MKRMGLILLVFLVIVGSLVGCNLISEGIDRGKENDLSQYQVFEADVISNKNGLLVTPDEDSLERSSSDKIYVGLVGAKVYDQDGNLVDEDMYDKDGNLVYDDVFKSGDRVKITYDGIILESYPAQISAKKVEIIGHNHIVDGIFAVIDDIYQEDGALNSGITMIAIDTSEWTSLTKAEIYTILAMAKENYEVEIVQGTFEELAEQGLIDEDNLYFEKGILIKLNDIKINKGRDKINCSIQKWRSGLGAIGWDAEAKLKTGEWKTTRDNMWIS
ncbi:MAG: DUF3221 domain-containing protein [Clostridiales bacterium]|nr:DUF3221 domain-containing protein [Clostridiales bacterium]